MSVSFKDLGINFICSSICGVDEWGKSCIQKLVLRIVRKTLNHREMLVNMAIEKKEKEKEKHS